MELSYKSFLDFRIGDRNIQSKTITETDVVLFSGLTGDFNPIHLDEEYAKTTHFGTRLVQGMLVASLVGAAAAPLCGNACINMGQSFTLPAPARIGDTLTAVVEIAEKHPESHELLLSLTVTRQYGKTVLKGTNTVRIMDRKKERDRL